MLRYRSLFTVADRKSTVDDVFAQVHAWLRSKRYDADALVWDGPIARIGENAEALLVTDTGRDHTRSGMFLLQEATTDGTWTTQVIAQDPGNGHRRKDWAWIDIDGPRPAGIPRVARDLLDVLEATDGRASLAAHPTVVRGDEAEDVLAALLDEERRGLVFVAGSTPDFPLPKWQDYVGRLLHDTVGLAAGYVLDAEATELLQHELGARHAVSPGTLRTFLPGVHPSEDLDALRHRFLTTETILATNPKQIARTLGSRAAELALAAEVPSWARSTRDRLEKLADEKYLDSRVEKIAEEDRLRNPEPFREDAQPAAHRPETETRPAPELITVSPAPSVLDELALELFGAPLDTELLRALAAAREVSDARAREIESMQVRYSALARERLEAYARAEDLGERSERARREARDVSAELLTVRQERDDIELEWTDALHQLEELSRQVRGLRLRLLDVGAHDAAWTPVEASPRDKAPESFAELLERLDGELDRVVFTGSAETTSDLDVSLPYGGSSVKAWNALLALEDYARAKSEGTFTGGVHHFLENTPDGCHGFSANRHARDESEDVKKNAKFCQPRRLPVPTHIDPSGIVFMGAHFKLANVGLISPRLHYLDATTIDGVVYVGYIGAHLPTAKTN